MCLDELADGMPKQRPFPIKALDDCMYGGFVYLQIFFFVAGMWGPLKYLLKHAGLTTLQLHVMSRNVPQPFSQRVNIIHRLTFPDLQTGCHPLQIYSFHHGKAGTSFF